VVEAVYAGVQVTDNEFQIELCNRLIEGREQLIISHEKTLLADAQKKAAEFTILMLKDQIATIKYRDSLSSPVEVTSEDPGSASD